jgi:hypothetical protein
MNNVDMRLMRLKRSPQFGATKGRRLKGWRGTKKGRGSNGKMNRGRKWLERVNPREKW